MKNKYFFVFLFLFSIQFSALAQIQINEYSASNLTGFQDSFFKTEDWIELYNNSDSDVDLGGWHLSDKETKPTKWEIPAGIIIPAKGYRIFLCSSRDLVVGDEVHTNFKLTQTKGTDIVLLSRPDGTVVESFPLTLTMVENSRCRTTDGAADWAICTQPTLGQSNNGSPQYTGYTIAPIMDVTAGFYTASQTITITNNEPNSVLHYTLDGTNPTTSSPIYTQPLTVSSTQVIKAQAFSTDPDILPGKMEFNTYFINEDFSLAVFSVAADSVIELAGGEGAIIPVGSVEYFDLTKERTATSFGTLNRHGQDSWVLDQRSLDWVSRDEMGYSKAVEEELFSYSDRNEYQRFMFRASGDDNYPAIDDDEHEGSTHVRDEYVHTLAQDGGMKLDLRAVERVIVFLNGRYWGVYGLRERAVDHDYTKEYYDQDKLNLQFLSTWQDTEAEYGGQAAFDDWIEFRDFILDNDMGEDANYQQVKDNLQVLGLIDYMIANLNTVTTDWLNYNTAWWRGRDPDGDHKKWGYLLWDNDASFDYYINYTGVPNTQPDAQPCDIDEISEFLDNFFNGGSGGGTTTPPEECLTIMNGSSPYPATDSVFMQVIAQDGYCCDNDWDNVCQDLYDRILNGSEPNGPVDGDVGRHEKIFIKLQEENDEFRQLYYSRQADLMNTVYSCENMLGTLDRMVDKIAPEMPRQISRWGGTMTEWQSNVRQLRSFVEQRCDLLDDGMTDCFNLTGPYELTLMTQPDGVGEIDLNTLDIETFPWTGAYFGGMENLIKAKAKDADYVFSHWESTSGSVIFPDETSRSGSISLTEADTLIAVFDFVLSNEDLVNTYSLQVFPNPTRDRLNISFDLPQQTEVEFSMVSVLGKEVANFPLISGSKTSGKHTIDLSLADKKIAGGMYFLVLKADNDQVMKKIMVMD